MSFRLKTILGIALIESVFLFVLIANAQSVFRENTREQIEQHATTLARLFASSVKDAVLSTDLATLNSLTEELIANPDVVYVRVSNDTATLSDAGIQPEGDLIKHSADTLPAYYAHSEPITVFSRPFGAVELVIDTRFLKGTLQTVKQQSIRIASLEIIFVALVSWLFGSYLTRQLATLRQATQNVQNGNYHFDFPSKPESKDEFEQTLSAFSEMSHALSELEKNNQQMIGHAADLNRDIVRRETWLRSVMDNLGDGIITLDENGLILSLNRSAEHMLGYKFEDIKGIHYAIFIVDERQRSRIDEFIRHARNHFPSSLRATGLEEFGYRRNGTPFPMELKLSSARQESETTFIMLLRDLTVQKAYEAQAKFNEAIKSGMLESSLSAVISINQKGRVVEFNPAAEKMFGYSRQEAMDQNIAYLILPERYRKAHHQGMKRYIATGEHNVLGKRIELTALDKSGREFPIEIAITPVKIEEETYFTSVIDDISDRLADQKRLEEAKTQAEEASLAKSQFLAAMSHEIRTPLSIVLGMVDLMKSTSLTEQQQHYLQSAAYAGMNLSDIINDVLDLSKIEAGKLELHPRQFDPVLVIEEVTQTFAVQAFEKKLHFDCVIHPNVPRSWHSDPVYFRQIILNLIGNAVKYTSNGQVIATCQFKNQQLLIQIIDTGPGIAVADQERVFQEFTQLEQSSAEKIGTGLGLVISRKLANLMGGEIQLSSSIGEGSTFNFTSASHQPTEAAQSPHHPVQVLLVSQNTYWLESNKLRCSWLGMETIEWDKEETAAPPHSLILVDTTDNDDLANTLSQLSVSDSPLLLTTKRHSNLVRLREQYQINTYIEPVTNADFIKGVQAARHGELLCQLNDKLEVTNKYQGNEERILLVEDSESNRIIAKTYLETANFKVAEASDGQQAIELLKHDHFDLILMDIRMPIMGGLEATQIIKTENLAPNIPIVALTAHALSSEKEKALKAGMDDFLTKPIDKSRLLETVERWLHKASQATPMVDDQPVTTLKPREAETRSPSLVDVSRLDQLAKDTSVQAAIKMLDIFRQEVPAKILSFERYVADKDFNQLEIHSHALKSSALTFGAVKLHEQAKLIESKCRNNDSAELAADVAACHEIYQQCIDAIDAQWPRKQ
ncbi:MAG: hypothetical protein CMF25_03100 [Kangiellaceae bacterium]|nr:hypothetical protein [Kangiellaceae bacterium]